MKAKDVIAKYGRDAIGMTVVYEGIAWVIVSWVYGLMKIRYWSLTANQWVYKEISGDAQVSPVQS
ncbi:hypothetical protein HYW61_02065 [candidate division WWE3 bacterium]|nr:hypothetical protein [candidate division WWE3 bacterium]